MNSQVLKLSTLYLNEGCKQVIFREKFVYFKMI